MTKSLIISFNFFILFAYKLFFGGEVSVKQNIPTSAKPGESFTVELIIEKGDREGFAKWQQKLPKGFIASNLSSEGATFSFKDQEIKLIWMALPTTEKLTIRYQVECSPELNGVFSLTGKFSYIEENERKEVVSEEKSIFIGAEAPLDVVEETIPVKEDSLRKLSENEEIPTPPSNNKEQTTPPVFSQANIVKNNVSTSDLIQIQREIIHVEGGDYQVNLTIEKNGFKNFGKIEEYLPPHYTASEIESSEGLFSFKGKVMKILWMTLPKESTITVSYGLKSNSAELDSANIFGLFSFLNEDESMQVSLKPTKFKNFSTDSPTIEEPEEIVEEVDQDSSTESNSGNEEMNSENLTENKDNNPSFVSNKEMESEETTTDRLTEEITNVPPAETSVSYKVQIAASKKEVQQQYFIDRHNISENVSIEYHDTWYKYTIGAYEVYKQARDKRNEIWGKDNKINDAFVTAYNQGNRISVQEALMITKQKWYN